MVAFIRIAAALFISAVSSVSAAPSQPRFTGLGPRIPSHAKHTEVLAARSAATEVDLTALVAATCLNPDEQISFHDETVAQLSICGGISGASTGCGADPLAPTTANTEGAFRSARFSLAAVDEDAVVTVSKASWARCVEAARAVCPTGSLSAVCAGGASHGSDVAFTLTAVGNNEL